MTFRTVLVDPPWSYRNRQSGAADAHYDTLSEDELAALPVPGDYCFLWATNPFLEVAFSLLREWGFNYKTALYWLKMSNDFLSVNFERPAWKPAYGRGYWFRGAIEPVLLGARPGVPVVSVQERGLIFQREHHSAKPEPLQDLIELHFPGPYLELFARRQREDWTCLGNELTGNDIRVDLAELLS